MIHSLTCYNQPDKAKSATVLAAFAAPAGVVPMLCGPNRLAASGASAFYGVVGIEHLLNQARIEKRDWFYGDNSYFDAIRLKHFRFTRNAFQESNPQVTPDYERLSNCGILVKPWKRDGRHIVVVEQSEHFLRLSGASDHWLSNVLLMLRRHTDRPVRVRRWSRNKAKAAGSLYKDLKDAWALVTHMSAAANEALLEGVPVYTSGVCAATPFASGSLAQIEKPLRPDGREAWAAKLIACEWTLEELREGNAWRRFNE